MNSNEIIREIREINLSYLLLAQQLVRESRAEAMVRLGVGNEVAEIINDLTPSQLSRLATSNMLLCRFRFDDHVILSALTHHAKVRDMTQTHAAILLAQQPVESLR